MTLRRGAEARRCLVNSIQRRRVSLSFTRFIVRLIVIYIFIDSDYCATRAEKVSDLVLPHNLGVGPCNYENVSGGGVCHTMLHKKNLFLRVEVTLNRYRSIQGHLGNSCQKM